MVIERNLTNQGDDTIMKKERDEELQIDALLYELELKDDTICTKSKAPHSLVGDDVVYAPIGTTVKVASSAMLAMLNYATDAQSLITISENIESKFGIPMTDEMIMRGKYLRAI